jgi:hypothetical protein
MMDAFLVASQLQTGSVGGIIHLQSALSIGWIVTVFSSIDFVIATVEHPLEQVMVFQTHRQNVHNKFRFN